MKRIGKAALLCVASAFILCGSALAAQFTDVPEDAWYAEAAFTFRLDTRTLGGVTFTRCADNTIETSGTPDSRATVCAAAYTNDGIMFHIEKISGHETLNLERDAAYYRFYAIDNNLRPLGKVTTMRVS